MLSVTKKEKYEGFSLFELIVNMGILLVLSMIVFPVAIQKAQEKRLSNYASQLVTDLYFQQQESFLKGTSRGLTVESNKYTLFDGESLAEATETTVKRYPNNIRIENISFSTGNEISFSSGSFRPTSHGTLLLTDGIFYVKVYINSEGLIGYENL